MGLYVLLTLEIVGQVLAAGLALRLARVAGKLAPWGGVGAAIGVLVLWQIADVARIATGSMVAPTYGAQVEDLILSLLLLLGLALMLRRFHATQQVSARAWRHDRRLRSLIENSLDIVTVLDAHATILYASPSTERVLGYDPETLVGRSVFDLVHSGDLTRVRDFLASRVSTPGVAPLIECRIQRIDGRWRHFEVAGNNLLDDPTVHAIMVNARDVTQRREAEERLHASERRFRRMVENSWDVFAMVSSEGAFEFISPSVKRVLGYDPADYVGRPIFEFVHPDDVLKLGEALRDILSEPGRSVSVELRGRNASGEWRWLDAVGTNLLDDPAVGAVVGVFRDKTERRRTEEALRSVTEGVSGATGKEFFHSLVVMLTQVLGVEYAVIAEWPGEDSDRIHTIAVCAAGEVLEDFDRPLAGSPCAGVLASRTCSYPGGVREEFPDDRLLAEFEVESYLGTPLLDSSRQVIGVIAVLGKQPLAEEQLVRSTLEIFAPRAAAELERSRAEEALRRSERSYRALVEHAMYGIFRSTPEGRFQSVNPALVSMLRYESEREVLELNLAQDVYVDGAVRDSLIEEHREADQIVGVEAEWKRKDGTPFTVRLSGRPVREAGGEIVAFEMIAEDVTERRALEDQLRHAQKMEAIGQLTGGIAHDFNNLLTVILANADMLEQGLPDGDGEFVEDLTDLRRAAQRGSDMVKKLLGYSRRGMIALRPLNIATVIANLLPTMRRILPENIEVRFLPRASEAVIRADEGALEQILFNLATNARDAMPDGGVLRIEVSHVLLDEGHQTVRGWGGSSGEYVYVVVTDTGHGMDAETKERIFDPFFTTKPTGLGTGLGMAMIYGLVKQQEGYIDIHSEVGKGTSVGLYFPLAPDDEAGVGQEEVEAGAPRGTETLLLVEDEDAIRRAAKRLLERVGYTVLLAADGEEALDVFGRYETDIDLVITDMVMPHVGGLELHNTLRDRGKTVQFLFTSGYAGDADEESSLDPSLPFLQKPWDVDELLHRVRGLLDRPVA
ncbi:MAG: PAS domain S-box protein [Gemmatimonadota bacterium]|nr:MAG: PAS domain S-box protein [Gemmatimonadota bacterium]